MVVVVDGMVWENPFNLMGPWGFNFHPFSIPPRGFYKGGGGVYASCTLLLYILLFSHT